MLRTLGWEASFFGDLMSVPVPSEWWHWTSESVRDAIVSTGRFRPELNTNTMLGTGVYFVRQGKRWGSLPAYVRCKVTIATEKILGEFSGLGQKGRDRNNVLWYLKENRVPSSQNGRSGSDMINLGIRNHFRSEGWDAIQFQEYEHEVLLVFNLDVLEVLGG